MGRGVIKVKGNYSGVNDGADLPSLPHPVPPFEKKTPRMTFRDGNAQFLPLVLQLSLQ